MIKVGARLLTATVTGDMEIDERIKCRLGGIERRRLMRIFEI